MVLSPDRTMKVALPKNHRLLADLCAPRFRNTARGLIIEGKADIKRRLGRSPDRGDAVVLACPRTPVLWDHRRGAPFRSNQPQRAVRLLPPAGVTMPDDTSTPAGPQPQPEPERPESEPPPPAPMPGAPPASPFVDYLLRRGLNRNRYRRGSKRSIGDW